MRSAEEWSESTACKLALWKGESARTDIIRAIQRDAIEAAAKVCGELVGTCGGSGLGAKRIRAMLPAENTK